MCVLISCSEDEDAAEIYTENIKVQFYANNLAFAQQTSTENEITEVQALVFIDNGNGYRYSYGASATSLNNTDSLSTTFDVVVYTEPNPVKIYILANANNAIADNIPLSGETEVQVKQKIRQSFTSNNISGNFPMWGEYDFPTGITTSLNNTFVQLKVLRAIARVDISASNVASSFTMTTIQTFRANSQIQIAPNAYSGNLLVSEPSIPASSSGIINTTPINVTDNKSESQLYLPESAAPSVANQLSDATCVVVGGRYNGSSDITYYRLDFEPDIPDYPFGQILRNHHYTFEVMSVAAPGWPTPEEAANNKSANIDVSVQDWTDAEIGVGLEGSDYFRITSREITTGTAVDLYGYTFVSTSVPDFTVQWSDASGTPLGTPAESIENEFFRVTKSRYIIVANPLTDNSGGSEIVQYVLIVAKRAHILIKITQPGS